MMFSKSAIFGFVLLGLTISLPIARPLTSVEDASVALVKAVELSASVILSTLTADLSPSLVSVVLPELGIHAANAPLYPLAGSLNNFDENFIVDGLDKNSVVWLVEAENRTAEDPVIIYSHGGAYVIGYYIPFSFFAYNLYQKLGNDRLSILLFDYTLSDDDVSTKFPVQLAELALLHNKVAESSDNIIHVGDSAGGHLALNLLRHIQYPVSGVSTVTAKPSAAVLVSPWVNLTPNAETDGASYTTNADKDYLNIKSLVTFGEYVLNDESLYDSPSVNYFNDTEAGWSTLVPSNVFVSAGEYEILRDDILSWTELAGIPDENIYIDPKGLHDPISLTPSVEAVTPKIVEFLERIL